MSIIAVYVTHPDLATAKRVAEHLLRKRLVACANFFPVSSCYWWQGKMESADEVVSLMKTRADLWDMVQAEVKKVHPYEVPCIVRYDVKCNPDYEAWVRQETVPAGTKTDY